MTMTRTMPRATTPLPEPRSTLCEFACFGEELCNKATCWARDLEQKHGQAKARAVTARRSGPRAAAVYDARRRGQDGRIGGRA